MDDADNGEETKTHVQLNSVFDEFGDVFGDRLTDEPFVCSSNKDLQESELHSYFNGMFHRFKAAWKYASFIVDIIISNMLI